MIRRDVLFALIILITLSMPMWAQEKDMVPDYSTTPRKDVPVEFTWNVADIFATKDAWIAEKERVFAETEKLDELKDGWTSSGAKMLALFKWSDELGIAGRKLQSYASFQSHMDLANSEYRMMLGELQSHFVQFQAKMAFVNSDILALGSEKFEAFLKEEPGLQPYAFNIRDTFRTAKHILPTDQQQIVSMSGLFASTASQAAGALRDVDLPNPEVTLSSGDKVTLNYPTFARYRANPKREDRTLVFDTFFDNVKKYENTFAILLDGGMKLDVFNSRVRKFENSLEARLDANNIDKQVFLNNIKMARENLAPLHRYLKLKKDMLGLDKLAYYDLYASSVKSVEKTYSWEDAEKIILETMVPLGDEYVKTLKVAFDNRWIDRYPNKDKQSGAYSSGIYGVHPYVKMNYTGDFENVSTLAHELGHSMHSYFSQKTQPYSLSGYSTFLAEMASTFNEHMLIDYLLKTETDDLLKLFILDNYVTRIRSTVYRQTLFAEFELAMHERVESGQAITADWLNKTYLDLTRAYYGHDKGVCEVGEFIKSEWAVIPHFYYNYYVYSYSTGLISSLALSEMVKNEGEAGRDRYIEFLSAGGSDYPLIVLKKAGVDMTTEAPFKSAYKRLGDVITEMEKIIERLKADGKLTE